MVRQAFRRHQGEEAVSENVKSLFGKGAEASDRVKAILAWMEGRLREAEADGVEIEGVVSVVFGSREGMDVCRAIWDVPDKIGSGRPVRGMIAMAALELSREALT